MDNKASNQRASLDAGRAPCYTSGVIGPARVSAGRWEKGHNMPVQLNPRLKVSAVFIFSALLSILVTSCSTPGPSKSSHSQALGDVVVALVNYTQSNGSGLQAVILATNRSGMKLGCVALSYAAGLPLGSTSVVATNLDATTLPKALIWTRREPEMHVDLSFMRRYGVGKVFELQAGQNI